ncbi:hypothetical protein Trydic_g13456, partial [Trypoxylus dichotomus]
RSWSYRITVSSEWQDSRAVLIEACRVFFGIDITLLAEANIYYKKQRVTYNCHTTSEHSTDNQPKMFFKILAFAAAVAVAKAGIIGSPLASAYSYSAPVAAPYAYSAPIAKVAAPLAYAAPAPIAYSAPIAKIAAPVAVAKTVVQEEYDPHP